MASFSSKQFYVMLKENLLSNEQLTESYVNNHLSQIIWKLAAMERSFPQLFASNYLTVDRVLDQLEKRFRREVLGGQRPCVRKLLNRDAPASVLMVFCVSDISSGVPNDTTIRVELTDGWYTIQALFDERLSNAVRRGKIKIGSKLATCNAMICGKEDGVDPLDDSYSSSVQKSADIYLKLFSNATKLARWDKKMGWCKEKFLNVSVVDTIPGGGDLPLTDIVILRRYPRMFLETFENSRDPPKRLTEAQEEQARRKWEANLQNKMEKAVDEVQSQCEAEVDENAPEVWQRMMNSMDSSEFFQNLSPSDQKDIEGWKGKRQQLVQDYHRKNFQDVVSDDKDVGMRRSKAYAQFLIGPLKRSSHDDIDMGSNISSSPSSSSGATASLTFWDCSEDTFAMLGESKVFRFHNLSVNKKLHEKLPQLDANAKTSFEEVKNVSIDDLTTSGFSARSFLTASQVWDRAGKNATGGIDVCGVIKNITFNQVSSSLCVYLKDPKGRLVRLTRYFDDVGSVKQWKLYSAKHDTLVGFKDVILQSTLVEMEGVADCVWSNEKSVLVTEGKGLIVEPSTDESQNENSSVNGSSIGRGSKRSLADATNVGRGSGGSGGGSYGLAMGGNKLQKRGRTT
jgi:hypothetical protein